MKLTFTPAHSVQKTTWDHRVFESACAIPYVFSCWLDDFCKQNWYLVEDKDTDFAFPIAVHQKWGIEMVYQPYFTQQLGWLPQHRVDATQFNSILKQLKSRFWIVHYHLNAAVQLPLTNDTYTLKRNFWIHKKENHSPRLFSENHRRNIKKAEKARLHIDRNISPHQVIDLFKLDRGIEMKHIGDDDYAPFIQNAQKSNPFYKWQMIGVRTPENELIAAAGFCIYKGRHIFAASGNSNTGKKYGAMHFLIANYLEHYVQTNEILDFEGSMDEGVGRFYAGFGSKIEQYISIQLERFPGLRHVIR